MAETWTKEETDRFEAVRVATSALEHLIDQLFKTIREQRAKIEQLQNQPEPPAKNKSDVSSPQRQEFLLAIGDLKYGDLDRAIRVADALEALIGQALENR